MAKSRSLRTLQLPAAPPQLPDAGPVPWHIDAMKTSALPKKKKPR